MARIRKLSNTGDYTFGQGSANFWVDSPYGVAQDVETRLLVWEGEWFLDNTYGTPWSQEILGYGNPSTRDTAIKSIILETDNVTSLADYTGVYNATTRKYTVSGSIYTAFSTTPVTFGPVNL